MNTVIEMKNVQKIFGQKQALKDVCCTIQKGEVFGLLGPSGAGKTTIMRILTGGIKATSGEAFVFGTPTTKLTQSIYNDIGMVFDDAGLYKRLSCFDNLLLFAKLQQVDKSKIYEVLEQVGLCDSIKKEAGKLSKGMAQRLVFARAILNSPKLLFLDEPTSGLDPATALKIHQIVRDLKENGTTVFLTTHNMEEATKLCDNVALLNEGTIVEYGTPKDLCNKYNKEQKITLTPKTGQALTLENNATSAQVIEKYLAEDNVRSLHTSEPNLETVFIELTGRNLI